VVRFFLGSHLGCDISKQLAMSSMAQELRPPSTVREKIVVLWGRHFEGRSHIKRQAMLDASEVTGTKQEPSGAHSKIHPIRTKNEIENRRERLVKAIYRQSSHGTDKLG
jgi:hypothetical protein